MKSPKGQTLWVSYRDANGKVKWILTSDPIRTMYFLYRVDPGEKLVKVKQSKSPKDFGTIAKGDLK